MNFDRLTKYIDTLEKCGIPGCEMHVAYEGRVVYSYAAGFSNKEHTRKADFGDMYRLYSCTKVVTSVCAMRLVEEGKLDFEDPVSKYLPEYADITVKTDDEGGFAPAKKVMKIKHLFSMTLSKKAPVPPVRLWHPSPRCLCNLNRVRIISTAFATTFWAQLLRLSLAKPWGNI